MAAPTFSFVDLFSGIGGFHIGCTRNGGVCRMACEIDADARAMYEKNYGIRPHDDINTLVAAPQPLDLVCAGFPCQSHSTLGLRRGLRDRRGQLFNRLCEFISHAKPRAFLFENVKGILHSTRFDRLIAKLSGLGYAVSWAVLDSQHFGLPQHRERVYIVGRRMSQGQQQQQQQQPFDFGDLMKQQQQRAHKRVFIRDILDPSIDSIDAARASGVECTIFDDTPVFDPPKTTAAGFVLRAQRSNFTNRKLFSSDGILGTIATGSPPPIYDERHLLTRHLTCAELKRCQGFPASFRFPRDAARSTVVHYVGNAVSVNVVQAIVRSMREQKCI
jgi:DNA-cytosine methyltransferase